MTVSIVIPNWNGYEKLKKNLPNVLAVEGVDEIIVSDDGSTDKSVELMEQEFPSIRVIKRVKNGGFSSNVNTGVKEAKSDLIFLLNSDASPEKSAVKKALKHFEDKQVFGVGCNTGGSWAWGYFDKGYFWHGQRELIGDKAHQTLWASGGSSIFRKDIWDELNGLDELFDPFYEEDVDLGYRATKRGFINIFEPQSKVEHYVQKGVIEENFSKAQVSKVAQRNQLLFIWKNIHSSKMMNEHIQALIKMLLIHPKYWLIFISALLRLKKLMKKRREEQKYSKLSDLEILTKYPR